MGKGDRRTRAKRAERRTARKATKDDALYAVPEIGGREPSGRRQRRPAPERNVRPTAEAERRKAALLRGKPGCVDDWIDVAWGQDILDERQAESLRRYRALILACQRVAHAPREAPDILGSLLPHTGKRVIEDEEAVRRIRAAREDAGAALNDAPRHAVVAIEAHLTQRHLPQPRSMRRIGVGAVWLIEHFEL